MKSTLIVISALALIPTIAIGVVLSAMTPAWLVAPALAFALFLLSVFGLVRFLGMVVGFFIRMLVAVVAGGMMLAALYAIALQPYHSLLAWIVIATALLAIASTAPPRPRPERQTRTHMARP